MKTTQFKNLTGDQLEIALYDKPGELPILSVEIMTAAGDRATFSSHEILKFFAGIRQFIERNKGVTEGRAFRVLRDFPAPYTRGAPGVPGRGTGSGKYYFAGARVPKGETVTLPMDSDEAGKLQRDGFLKPIDELGAWGMNQPHLQKQL